LTKTGEKIENHKVGQNMLIAHFRTPLNQPRSYVAEGRQRNKQIKFCEF